MPLNSNRRKQLLDWIPDGSITTRTWLIERGLNKHSIDNLVKSAQLETIVHGVYKRIGTEVTWQGLIYFLQIQQKTDLTIGGISAIDILGLSHYLSLGKQKVIHLYGKDKLPIWINQIVPSVRYVYHDLNNLFRSADSKLINDYQESSFFLEFTVNYNWKENKEGLRLCSAERAYLEILMDVPQKISFEHADQVMQGLTFLSPRKLQKLLLQCCNVKVKRLFFWMAERQHYNWLEKLNINEIDFGSGKRVLAKNGKLNKKYLITVPDLNE